MSRFDRTRAALATLDAILFADAWEPGGADECAARDAVAEAFYMDTSDRNRRETAVSFARTHEGLAWLRELCGMSDSDDDVRPRVAKPTASGEQLSLLGGAA